MASPKLDSYLAEVQSIAGGLLKVEVVRPQGGAAGGNDPTTRTVWIVDDLGPQLSQEVLAHEATHIALYYQGWAFTRTPANGADVRILQGIGALITNTVQPGDRTEVVDGAHRRTSRTSG